MTINVILGAQWGATLLSSCRKSNQRTNSANGFHDPFAIDHAKTYDDLPQKARDYVEYIEKFVGVKIKYIGTGPDRLRQMESTRSLAWMTPRRVACLPLVPYGPSVPLFP
ncbi:hypothetical protein ACRALDRAFT_1068497 [Sodiomyces alcalophilus JCM 7366]|uniref:uncharacterized protein n=1 Tax=Sodiomyces alcalophilus JCM 7366 TaxID=591952 RepID=UPI0039B4005A